MNATSPAPRAYFHTLAAAQAARAELTRQGFACQLLPMVALVAVGPAAGAPPPPPAAEVATSGNGATAAPRTAATGDGLAAPRPRLHLVRGGGAGGKPRKRTGKERPA